MGSLEYPNTRIYITQKGGVGKSTSCVEDSDRTVTILNKRTLHIDLDPQGNSSTHLGIERAQFEELEEVQTLPGMFRGLSELPDIVMSSPSVRGLDIIPGGVSLTGIEVDSSLHGLGGKLRRQLEKYGDRWDEVRIDMPPHLGKLTYVGVAAATEAVIPFELSGQSIEALGPVLEMIRMTCRQEDRDDLESWILPTKADFRQTLDREAYKMVKDRYGDKVLPPISRSVKVPEAFSARQPLQRYAPASKPNQEYQEALKIINKTTTKAGRKNK
jgi:chromosome partitioning protein